MENNPTNRKDQPDLHQSGRDEIGSPLNPGHQKQQTTGTNDQNGDLQEKGPASVPDQAAQTDDQSLDGKTAGGINDPRANETPHPGAADGAPKPAGG